MENAMISDMAPGSRKIGVERVIYIPFVSGRGHTATSRTVINLSCFPLEDIGVGGFKYRAEKVVTNRRKSREGQLGHFLLGDACA